ncbi:unnamed protein product [Amoebophrya sp. A120]|nr:unnamed protein product [Amoebophrya sp. A120]|eukprot:GSA120T00002704001.1
MATGRQQQAGIGLGIVGDGKGWSGAATRSDGLANRSDKINRLRPQVYLDITVNGDKLGRVTFELFADVTPRTAENFRQLCLGVTGRVTKKKSRPLGYKGTKFHRMIPDFCLQGGDLDHLSGRGGESIYGEKFDDENFQMKHDKSFLLSMANSGRNTNGSQFFITSKALPSLDGKHVVFGEAIAGMDLLLKMEGYGSRSGAPSREVVIADCGEVSGTAAWQFRERNRAVTKDEKLVDAQGNPLPPNWIKLESRSKPGLFYYQHVRNGNTQFEIPLASTSTGRVESLKRAIADRDGGAENDKQLAGTDLKKPKTGDSNRACRKDEIRILVFEKRHRNFFGKPSKSWRDKNITLSQEEAKQKLEFLREKMKNARIGGGDTALRTKWLNFSSLENDCDKANWTIGPVKRGGLISLGYDKKIEELAFSLKKGDLSECTDMFNAQIMMFRIE